MLQSEREEVLITNLPDRVTEGQVSATTKLDHWRIVDYVLEEIGPGKGLIPNGQPGPLTIELEVSGQYQISLVTKYAHVYAKLSGEESFDECEAISEGIEREGWYSAEEVLWREADLTDRDLVVDDESGNLLAIRLVPVGPGDSSKAERASEVRWPMVFTHDDGVMFESVHETPDELFELCERIQPSSCVRLMIYMAGFGDVCLGPTDVGTTFGELGQVPWRDIGLNALENVKRYHQWGINPTQAMVEYGHDRGWEVYLYVRHRGYGHTIPLEGPWDSRFFHEHPEYRNIGPNDEPVLGLSVAYPEVREHLCEFYAELAGLGADGVSPCFIRGCPIVLYEPPMVDGFQEKYGEDPRQLPEWDPRWLDYTAEVVNTFMRQLNEAIGPDCKLSPMIHGTYQLNHHFGMDIATWVAEGIVGDLFIMGDGYAYGTSGIHSYAGWKDGLDYEYFQRLPGREGVRLWPMFYAGHDFEDDPIGHCRFLQRCLDQGADGYGLWDAASHASESPEYIWDLGKLPRPVFKDPNVLGCYHLLRWCGFTLSKYSTIEGW